VKKNQNKHKLIRHYPANPRTGAKPNSKKKNDEWALAKVWNGEWTDRQHGRIQVPQPPMTEHSRHKQPFRAKQIWKRKPITVSHPKQIQNRTAAEIRAWSCRSQQICRRTRNPKPRKAKQAVQPPERSRSTTTQPSHDGEKMRSKTKWVEEANRTQKYNRLLSWSKSYSLVL
jgi:hypothetical protein